jgi:hypothetical protein
MIEQTNLEICPFGFRSSLRSFLKIAAGPRQQKSFLVPAPVEYMTVFFSLPTVTDSLFYGPSVKFPFSALFLSV